MYLPYFPYATELHLDPSKADLGEAIMARDALQDAETKEQAMAAFWAFLALCNHYVNVHRRSLAGSFTRCKHKDVYGWVAMTPEQGQEIVCSLS